jgi:hypothetical protein
MNGPPLRQRCTRLSFLRGGHKAGASSHHVYDLPNTVSASLQHLTQHASASLSLDNGKAPRQPIHAWGAPVRKDLLQKGLSIPVEGTPLDRPSMPRP